MSEVTGNVDLSGRVADEPSADAQFEAVYDVCSQLARDYVGDEVPPNTGFGIVPIAPESWRAGRRVVQCTVGPVDGTVTTSLRG